MSSGDDVAFFAKQHIGIEYIISRYFSWSSRIFIELPLIFFSKHDILFRIANILIFLSIPICICYIFYNFDKKHIVLLIVLLSLYNIKSMESAGIRATNINYLWPLAAFVMHLFLEKLYRKTQTKIYFLLSCILLLFACNNEQICLISCCYYSFIAILMFKKSSFYKENLLFAAIAFISLLFILTCPGNYVRFKSETLF